MPVSKTSTTGYKGLWVKRGHHVDPKTFPSHLSGGLLTYCTLVPDAGHAFKATKAVYWSGFLKDGRGGRKCMQSAVHIPLCPLTQPHPALLLCFVSNCPELPLPNATPRCQPLPTAANCLQPHGFLQTDASVFQWMRALHQHFLVTNGHLCAGEGTRVGAHAGVGANEVSSRTVGLEVRQQSVTPA